MIEIITNTTIHNYVSQVMEFNEKIFIPSFPDPNEREYIEDIIERVCSGKAEIILSIDCYNILGGVIIDLYPNINSVEIIYIATDPNTRGKGIGKELIQAVKERYRNKNIFLEVDIPVPSSSFSYTRKEIWRKWGAKDIPFHYIQPPLSPGKECVDCMGLMILDREEIERDELISFLKEFYSGLGALERIELRQMIMEIEELEGDVIYLRDWKSEANDETK